MRSCVVPVGDGAAGVIFDGLSIWVASNGINAVTRLRPSDGAVLERFRTGIGPFGVAFDGAAIWVANFGEDDGLSTSR